MHGNFGLCDFIFGQIEMEKLLKKKNLKFVSKCTKIVSH